jgi:hypothetical protein
MNFSRVSTTPLNGAFTVLEWFTGVVTPLRNSSPVSMILANLAVSMIPEKEVLYRCNDSAKF